MDKEKLTKLRKLEAIGIIREECPMPDDYGGTAYWSFKVLRPTFFTQRVPR